MSDEDEKRDAVLRRMLKTPPMPKTGKGKAKAPVKPAKLTAGKGRARVGKARD